MEATNCQLDDLQLLRKINKEILDNIERKHATNISKMQVDKSKLETKAKDLASVGQSPILQYKTRIELKAKIRESHKQIAKNITGQNAQIVPRTQVHNRKCAYQSINEERLYRLDALGDQIKSWRSILPGLIRKFAKIPGQEEPRAFHIK